MIEQVVGGSTVNIRVFLWDGGAIVTGESPVVSIERESDGTYWNGTIFTTYNANALVEDTGNVGVEAVYTYAFVTPIGVAGYDWSVKHTIGGQAAYWKGRIRTT